MVGQLQQQFKIEPCFTQLVWQKLEEQNQEFFKAYYTRLKLKDQIVLFNHLLDEQVKMFGRMPHGGHLMPGRPRLPSLTFSFRSGMCAGLQIAPVIRLPAISAPLLMAAIGVLGLGCESAQWMHCWSGCLPSS